MIFDAIWSSCSACPAWVGISSEISPAVTVDSRIVNEIGDHSCESSSVALDDEPSNAGLALKKRVRSATHSNCLLHKLERSEIVGIEGYFTGIKS